MDYSTNIVAKDYHKSAFKAILAIYKQRTLLLMSIFLASFILVSIVRHLPQPIKTETMTNKKTVQGQARREVCPFKIFYC